MTEEQSSTQVTAVVPCFNEAEAIQRTVEELESALAGGACFEVIVVDDGSTDATGKILEELESGGDHPHLRVLRHPRNRGYGASVKTGIRRARGEIVVITDADGTYPHDRVAELVELVAEADMAVGARVGEGVSYSWLRRIPKVFLQAYTSWLVGERIPDMNSGLRAFRRTVAERFFKVLPDGFSLTTTITVAMMRGGFDVRFVPISYSPRVGRSKIRPIRDTLRFIQLIVRTGMYFAPLRVLLPIFALLFGGFLVSAGYDVLVLEDLTDKTILLLLFAMNTALFALLADMIDKRS